MGYLIFSIISSTSIFIIFRWAKNFSCNISNLIIINYLVASILGIFLFILPDIHTINATGIWFPWSVVLGILFVVMFFLIGFSSQKAGITVTTIANKLSLVFPVMFSMIWFNEKIPTLKYFGLAISLIAIFLTIYRKESKKLNLAIILLPLLIFTGSGITDSVVKYVQAEKTSPDQVATFTTFVFIVAFMLSALFSVAFHKKNSYIFSSPTLLLGILLGIVNFGSLYFFINALNKSNLESSLVFAINNMSIVMLSSIFGNFIFNEKLSKLNYAGILLALLSIYFLV